MKLNADIIFDELSQLLKLEICGPREKELTLKRPKLYGNQSRPFQAGYIYVVMADRLPAKPVIEQGAVFLTLGGRPPAIYQSRCCCMVCAERDILTVFDMVQQIFDRYDAWESDLQHILDTTADLQEMLDRSDPVLRNPAFILDTDNYYLAYSKCIDELEILTMMRPDENNRLRIQGVSTDISQSETKFNKQTTQPILLMDKGTIINFSLNLFVRGVNVGCLAVNYLLNPYRESSQMLIQFLARMVEKVFLNSTRLFSIHVSPLQTTLKDLLDGIPVEDSRIRALDIASTQRKYLCAKLIQSDWSRMKVSGAYIITQLENAFPDSVVFEYQSFIIAFIALPKKEGVEQAVQDTLCGFMEGLLMKGGVSCPCEDLSAAWFYYRQASLALEMGSIVDPEGICYPFPTYKVAYLVRNGMGELSLESLMNTGLRRLAEHDHLSQISYLDTLRAYLDNNLNITQTAKTLHVHRSTFLERIKRITGLLDMDLEDPDHQLYLRIILKALELRKKELENSAQSTKTSSELT